MVAEESIETEGSLRKRLIVFHYHLFKNAGTSVDRILKDNFSGQWVTKEFFDYPVHGHHVEVGNWIKEDRNKISFSSHTAFGPVPKCSDVDIYSVIFIRHPIERLWSAYQFERRQNASSLGSVLASETSFRGYVRVRLAISNDRFCTNFHTFRLASFFPNQGMTEAARAVRAMDELSLVGVVEQFEDSMTVFGNDMKKFFPEFNPTIRHENAGSTKTKLRKEKEAQLKHELGKDLWDELIEQNKLDFELHNLAVKKLEKRLKGEL